MVFVGEFDPDQDEHSACNLHSVFCNRVIFLLLKHRRSRMVEIPDASVDNHQQSGALYIFTTVCLDPMDNFPQDEEIRWQAGAERAWIR
ncbi:hypothetical protein CVT25_011675 [Psilocybe cyanescens]|uniref:Uncharacterized protein n=1 Tax=Psilocybe cyanescens TaxID=93625 RepID=A0A409XWJ9_PSICY|nr:hypothetical protein CVT25_011675 [Psilocybe cyanescens]